MSCPRSVGELGADGSLVASADFKSVAVSGDRRWVGSIPTRSRQDHPNPFYCDLSDESSTGAETPCLGIASLLVIEQRQMKAMPVVEIVEIGTEPLCVRWGKPKTLKHFASAGLRLGE